MKKFGKHYLKIALALTLWIFLGANLILAADTLPAKYWSQAKEGGNNGNDMGYSVAIDSQGNVITVGYITGAVGHAIDAYAIKYDRNGNFVCEIKVDSGGPANSDFTSSDTFAGVKVDSQDNIILTGTIAGNFYDVGYYSAPYIRKYDKDCNPIWDPMIINYNPWTSAWQNSQEIAVDKDDNIYIAGNVFEGWGMAEHEWAIWKFDKDGYSYPNFPILYNYSNHYYIPDYVYGIAVDSVGNIIAAGMRGVSGCDGCLNKDYDWHVRKYDPLGVFLWEDTYAGSANLLDYAYKVAVDSNDDIIVAGFTNKGADNSTNTNYDWLVIKYAKDGVGGAGQRLWTKTYESGSGRTEQALNVAVDSSDNVVVVGYVRDDTNSYNMGRVALLNGVDGNQLDEIVFEEQNLLLYGVAQRGNLLAVSGQILNSNYDIFTALLLSVPPLIAPVGGEAWEPFSKQTILWDKTLISGKSKINLSYSTDSGGTWSLINPTGPIANKGKYTWVVPDISPDDAYPDTCMISVSNVDNTAEFLASGLFSIGFPKITDFNEKRVYVGDTITINGNFFGTKAGKVYFGKGKGKVTAWTPTSITVQVPTKNALSGPFTVVTAAKNEAVSFPSDLVILPKITKVSPSSGTPGKKVTISGSGFGTTANIVTFFDSIPATVLTWSDTKISVEVPAGATTGRIQVTNAAGDSATSTVDFIIE